MLFRSDKCFSYAPRWLRDTDADDPSARKFSRLRRTNDRPLVGNKSHVTPPVGPAAEPQWGNGQKSPRRRIDSMRIYCTHATTHIRRTLFECNEILKIITVYVPVKVSQHEVKEKKIPKRSVETCAVRRLMPVSVFGVRNNRSSLNFEQIVWHGPNIHNC